MANNALGGHHGERAIRWTDRVRCDAALDSIGLAVSKAERVAALPDVPTFAEAGVADFLVSTWFGLYAPR